ncbi:hypothetical protein R3Q06_00935 [Rhodococcus erythropolis]|uniref:hypothetical protein n=1 Tax=Rhodococcus erythropolis TaxID=1833 RepID=UPI0029494155|nr:hypothetical protein [Rhodococcus erythropolis]MDV6272052.1 hypothetical protein [Rhodococcus erythropolis]
MGSTSCRTCSAWAAVTVTGVVPVGIIGFSRLDESTLNAIDFSGIAHVSETDTDISAEKLLAVDPDLVIDIWSSYNGGNVGSIWGDDIARVEEVAPIAGAKNHRRGAGGAGQLQCVGPGYRRHRHLTGLRGETGRVECAR